MSDVFDRTASGLLPPFRTVVLLASCMMLLATAATVAHAPHALLTILFTASPALVLPLAWQAARTAHPELQRFSRLAAGAFALQAVGALGWCAAFISHGGTPSAPGYWTPLLYLGLAVATAASWAAVRHILRLREAVLDYSIVVAALSCVTVTVVHQQLQTGWSVAELDASVRSLIGLFLVILIASATCGRWQGLPLPVGLVGLSMAFYVLCSLSLSILAGSTYRGGVWPSLLWFAAGLCAMLAAVAIVQRVDRPVRISCEALPGVSPSALLLWTVAAWTVAAGIGLYGTLIGDRVVLCAGAGAIGWIGFAAMLRAVGALRAARAAYRQLEDGHVRLEHAEEQAVLLVQERDATIEQLARRNVELTTIMTLLGSLMEVIDERSNGELRAQIEETADDLISWLPQHRHPK